MGCLRGYCDFQCCVFLRVGSKGSYGHVGRNFRFFLLTADLCRMCDDICILIS